MKDNENKAFAISDDELETVSGGIDTGYEAINTIANAAKEKLKQCNRCEKYTLVVKSVTTDYYNRNYLINCECTNPDCAAYRLYNVYTCAPGTTNFMFECFNRGELIYH